MFSSALVHLWLSNQNLAVKPVLQLIGQNSYIYGYRLARELTDIAYKNLTTSQISIIRVWIVAQNGVSVNLRNDDLVVTLSLKLTKRVTEVTIKP